MASHSFFFIFTFITLLLISSVSSSTEFVYNRDFNSTNIVLSGNATIQNSVLTLTNQSFFSIGRAFYPYKIAMKHPNSPTPLPFATSFIFSVSPIQGFPTAHGFAFVFSPVMDIYKATSGNYLGILNRTNDGESSDHIFGIEFDDFRNEEFNDIDDNHVGVDLNSLISSYSKTAGFWDGDQLEKLQLDSGENYQVWIELVDFQLNITMAPAGKPKPRKSLISERVNLSDVLLNEMYIGFSGATGRMVDICRILAWSFSNSNFSIGDALLTRNLPSYLHQKKQMVARSKGFIAGITLGSLLVICSCTFVFLSLSRARKRGKEDEEKNIEDWELEYWPHRISYQDIHDATGGFSEENVIGSGTSGTVYKGVLQGVQVAVKRLHHDTQYGMREFVAEISSLGRMKHRNLVGFRGWCKRKRGNLILVYDYMENGSLDKRIFECEDSTLLRWEQRRSVLQNVASGILYLHEGWEVEVLHRDIKAGNVLLDKDMNARLGDFGLARLHHQEQLADTTRVIGTLGYMAPDLVRIGRPSKATDVYSFGILVLEVLCGRRPFVADKPALIDWVRSLMESGNLCDALDDRLKAQGGFNIREVERLFHLGLICSTLDPKLRPTIRQVLKVLEKLGGSECDEECFDGNLLEKINSAAMWSRHSSNFTEKSYPTFEEIMQSKYYTTTTISDSCYSLPPEEAYVSEGRKLSIIE